MPFVALSYGIPRRRRTGFVVDGPDLVPFAGGSLNVWLAGLLRYKPVFCVRMNVLIGSKINGIKMEGCLQYGRRVCRRGRRRE